MNSDNVINIALSAVLGAHNLQKSPPRKVPEGYGGVSIFWGTIMKCPNFCPNLRAAVDKIFQL